MVSSDPHRRLRVAIAWSGILRTDDANAARLAAQLFADPRVEQFFDPHRRAAEWVAQRSGLDSLAKICARLQVEPTELAKNYQPEFVQGHAAQFDTVCFIEPGTDWQQLKLDSDNWVSLLDPRVFSGYDAARYKRARDFELELRRLTELHLQRAAAPTGAF